jgi:hypothetical protein
MKNTQKTTRDEAALGQWWRVTATSLGTYAATTLQVDVCFESMVVAPQAPTE